MKSRLSLHVMILSALVFMMGCTPASDRGTTGNEGEAGVQGTQGAKGETGPKGETGSTG